MTTTSECSARVLLIRILYSRWVHNICLCWSTVYKILIQSNQSYHVYRLRTIRSPLDEYYTGGGILACGLHCRELQWRRMSGKLVRVPADKKRPEMNGAASRRLGNYRKDGNGVIELWWKYYVVAANRSRGRDYASTNGRSSDIKPLAKRVPPDHLLD